MHMSGTICVDGSLLVVTTRVKEAIMCREVAVFLSGKMSCVKSICGEFGK